MVIVDYNGKVVAKVRGPGTNHYLLGMTETRKRVADMTSRAKLEAGIPEHIPLTAIGLGLSGCENEESNQALLNGFADSYPTLSKKYAIGSDTEGSIAATSNRGGVTCIAGTGSNTLLINPDGFKVQCGGWGYILGDEGSAYKIALRAIKICFDHNDSFERAPYPIDVVYETIKEHFQIESLVDLLEHCYTRFDKPFIAALCKKLSNCANEGDELSKFIFREAGVYLARAIAAVVPKASSELIKRDGGLHILCVGSVWLSWDLLKLGFVSWLDEHTDIKQLSLMKLTTTLAVGAAYMAADHLNINVPRDYEHNYDVFYHYERSYEKCNGKTHSFI